MFKTNSLLPTRRSEGRKPLLCFARFVFLTFRGPLASHDSNPYPNRSRIARYDATKMANSVPGLSFDFLRALFMCFFCPLDTTSCENTKAHKQKTNYVLQGRIKRDKTKWDKRVSAKFCSFLWFSAKILRLPAVFCEDLHLQNDVISTKSEDQQKSAKNCEFGSVLSH